jgi:hypothetical protein
MSDETTGGDEIDAIWARVFDAVHDILQQRRDPVEVAGELDDLRFEVMRLEAALERFAGLAEEHWDAIPHRQKEIEHDILIAAEKLRRKFSQ